MCEEKYISASSEKRKKETKEIRAN